MLGPSPTLEVQSVVDFLACEQALLFGRAKRVSREHASERQGREGQRKGPSLARSREARPNRRACSQAIDFLVNMEPYWVQLITC